MKLIIEASLKDVHLGLFDAENHTLALEKMVGGRGEKLDALFQSALKKSGAKSNDIQDVLVTRGPGSFTGLRTGLAFAMGLCFDGKSSLRTPSTLLALSCLAPTDRKVAVLIPSRPGTYYLGIRSPKDVLTDCLVEESLVKVEDLELIQKEELIWVAESSAIMGPLASVSSDHILDYDEKLSLEHFLVLFDQMKTTDAVSGVKPLYLQGASVTRPKAKK